SLSSTGGPVSMLNNNVLDKSDFITGAFPAQYGNALSSVFDLRMRNGNTQQHEFLAQVGFNGFEANAEGPLSANHKASYLASYRYSTLGAFSAIGINFGTGTATPAYQDGSFKFFIPLSEKTKLSVFGMGGGSGVDFYGNDVDTTITDLYGDENVNVKVKYLTLIGGLELETNFNTKAYGKFFAGISTTHENYDGDSISVITREAYPNGIAQFETQKYTAGYQFAYKFNAKNSLLTGFNTDAIKFDLFNAYIKYDSLINPTQITLVDNNDVTLLTQAFMQLKHRFTENFSAVAGLHAQQLTLNNDFALEPRLGLKYMFNNKQALSLGYGLHSQMQNIYTYYVETTVGTQVMQTNKSLGFTKAHHFVLSYDYTINDKLRLKAETYYQDLFDAPVTQNPSSFSGLNTGNNFGPSDEDSLVNNGTGTNYGVELTVEKFYGKGYYFLTTVSVFDSKYKGSDGIKRNTAFNTGYALNVLGGKEFKLKDKSKIIALDIKVSTTGGRYTTPLDTTASAQEGRAVYKEDEAYSVRQSAYFRVDAKITYRKNYAKSTLEFSLDLQNVTNHQNIFYQSYNPRTNEVVNEYQQGFFPVPTVRFTF
ncbi:MAG TPA: TonB-dependent receptor, partial [Bacteroidia bacterium]|nr:TonB-dependent receptor [Bacteroidia bacterium]